MLYNFFSSLSLNAKNHNNTKVFAYEVISQNLQLFQITLLNPGILKSYVNVTHLTRTYKLTCQIVQYIITLRYAC